MSVRVMTLVWDVEFPNLSAKMVALKLADCANDDGRNIFPSVRTIKRTTGCAKSTIRKWLFAMEFAGLLLVKERSAGGANNDTTIRAFDMARLRALADGVKALAQDTIEHYNDRLDKMVTVPVFRIIDPADTPPRDGGVESDTSPPDGGDPSTSGRGPLHVEDRTPPPVGPKPLGNRHGTSPPTPQGVEREEDFKIGFAKGWTDQAQEAIEQMRGSPMAAHVTTDFLDLVVGTLNPPRDVDPPSYVHQVESRLAKFFPHVLRGVADSVLGERERDLPSVAKLEELSKTHRDLEAIKAMRRDEGPNGPTTYTLYRDRHADLFDAWMAVVDTETRSRALVAGAIIAPTRFPLGPDPKLIGIGSSSQ